jgi:hypothetical protein
MPVAALHSQSRVLFYYGRHDWTVDRCGTEVKYIIDYYDNGNSYWIDARYGFAAFAMV